MTLRGKKIGKNTKKYKNKNGISGVYSITNVNDGLVYIGESFNIEERWVSHIDELEKGKHHNKKLQTDWNTYGKENFKFEILEKLELEFICDGLPHGYKKCVLLIKESEYMNKYDSYNNGYNAEYTVDEILVGNKDKELLNYLVNCIHIYKNNDNRIPDSICNYLQSKTDTYKFKPRERNKCKVEDLTDTEKTLIKLGLYDIEQFTNNYTITEHELDILDIEDFKSEIISSTRRKLSQKSFNELIPFAEYLSLKLNNILESINNNKLDDVYDLLSSNELVEVLNIYKNTYDSFITTRPRKTPLSIQGVLNNVKIIKMTEKNFNDIWG